MCYLKISMGPFCPTTQLDAIHSQYCYSPNTCHLVTRNDQLWLCLSFYLETSLGLSSYILEYFPCTSFLHHPSNVPQSSCLSAFPSTTSYLLPSTLGTSIPVLLPLSFYPQNLFYFSLWKYPHAPTTNPVLSIILKLPGLRLMFTYKWIYGHIHLSWSELLHSGWYFF